MIPNSVILDTDAIIRQLRQHAKYVEPKEGRFFINDIIEDTMSCLPNLFTALRQLNDFVDEIRQGRYEYGYTLIKTEFADVVLELGLSIFHQLRFMRAYRFDGVLPYHYCAVMSPAFNDILLVRTHELP